MVVDCPKCPAQFATQRDLERHLERKIPCDQGSHKCEGCSSTFLTKRSLQEHLQKQRCKGKSAAVVSREIAEENAAFRRLLEQQESGNPSNQASTTEVDCATHDEPSQPPIDTSPAIIDQAGFFEFENKKIRKTSETPQRVSVYDFIAAVTDDKNPRTTFIRLPNNSELVGLCSNFKFSGSGQRDTPVTDAKGIVLIIDSLSGPKAAKFRSACADIIVRYLGGDETLISEIKQNQLVQVIAPETNPVRLFGEAVNAARFHDACLLTIKSASNVQEFQAPQFYFRQVLGKWSNLHPVGRPQEAVSPDQLSEVAVVKIGSMGVNTKRQETHVKQFDRSELLDSCLTSSFTHVETKAKDYWRDKGELYEGLHESKSVGDIELLLVRNQEDYERYLAVVQQLCERFPYIPDQPQEDTALELSLAQERSKQIEAEARKAEAKARKAEADARKVEAKLEMFKLKLQTGQSYDE